jgi:sensor histidine kinase regulating citrate/malate metabolism
MVILLKKTKQVAMKRIFSERPVRTQMLMMIFAVLMLQLLISGLIFAGMVADFLRFQIGEKALNIAQTMTTSATQNRSSLCCGCR